MFMPDPLNVLIVDDDETILSLLEEVFSGDPSLRITTLADSQEAYEVLGTGAFDLIITDLMMPKVDGLKLLEKAVAHKPDALVVIITGYASLETTLCAIHGGVYDYITKPFRVEEFRLLVHNAAARIRLMRQNKDLLRENSELKAQLAALRAELRRERSRNQSPRFEPELTRNGQNGDASASSPLVEAKARIRLSSYEKGLETRDERYEREIRHLEELFFAGRLTPEVFEAARQRLKTMI